MAKEIKLKGDYETRQVWLDGELVDPEDSFKVHVHSPDGFAWAYGGSGPSQLALAICLKLYPRDEALKKYMDFKFKHIATLPDSDFEVNLTL